jgi:hypothetical protein
MCVRPGGQVCRVPNAPDHLIPSSYGFDAEPPISPIGDQGLPRCPQEHIRWIDRGSLPQDCRYETHRPISVVLTGAPVPRR